MGRDALGLGVRSIETRWSEPVHDPDEVLRREHLEAIADEATSAFAKAMSRGHYEIAGAFAAEVGDDAEDP